MDVKEFEKAIEGMDAELKKFFTEERNQHMKMFKDYEERIVQLEQKGIRSPSLGGRPADDLGRTIVESSQYKNFVENGPRESGKIKVGSFFKTALVNATGQAQPLVAPYRVPGIVTPATPRLTIRDLFPAIPITTNAVNYTRETSFTNNAAMQGAGTSPLVRENVVKAESALAFELKLAEVQTLAHWIPASKQLLDDQPAMQAYLDTRLRFGLKLVEENQLLNGDGTNNSLSGLVTNATAYDTARNLVNDTRNDTIRHALTQVDLSFYPSEFVILHPNDWEKIELIKSTQGEYIGAEVSSDGIKRRWGKVIVDTPSMPQGNFLVGSSLAARLWDRQEATFELSRSHSDFWIRNLVACLCEERLTITIEAPAALVFGAFPS
jgi:HK97 family phage major capsid protein